MTVLFDDAILHSDNHLLAVNKPAGMPSQPDASGDVSLVEAGKEYVKVRFGKPGNVYLALLHRLDRPTSGLCLLARTDKAAGRMADAFRRREVGKTYWAMVECLNDPGVGRELRDYLVPLANGGMRRSADKTDAGKEARLAYKTLATAANGRRALLEIHLETGVKHQIRCQLAGLGLPIVGDFRYGPEGRPARPDPVANGRAILLHARRLAFMHPVRREQMTICAPLPGHWTESLKAFPENAVPKD